MSSAVLSRETRANTTAVVALRSSGNGAVGPNLTDPRSASHYGKERTLRVIATLGIKHIIFVRISEPVEDHGRASGPDHEINRIAASLQGVGCSCTKLDQNFPSVGGMLRSVQPVLEGRPVLLLEPHRLLTAMPAYFGRMLRFGLATGLTLVGTPPVPGKRAPESIRELESDLAMEITDLGRHTVDVWNEGSTLSLSRGGCYVLATDFWEFLPGTTHDQGEDSFDVALRSTPGAIAYVHAPSGIATASEGYTNVSGPTRIVRSPIAGREQKRWRVVSSGQNP